MPRQFRPRTNRPAAAWSTRTRSSAHRRLPGGLLMPVTAPPHQRPATPPVPADPNHPAQPPHSQAPKRQAPRPRAPAPRTPGPPPSRQEPTPPRMTTPPQKPRSDDEKQDRGQNETTRKDSARSGEPTRNTPVGYPHTNTDHPPGESFQRVSAPPHRHESRAGLVRCRGPISTLGVDDRASRHRFRISRDHPAASPPLSRPPRAILPVQRPNIVDSRRSSESPSTTGSSAIPTPFPASARMLRMT